MSMNTGFYYCYYCFQTTYFVKPTLRSPILSSYVNIHKTISSNLILCEQTCMILSELTDNKLQGTQNIPSVANKIIFTMCLHIY